MHGYLAIWAQKIPDRCHLVFTKTLEQDTILEANRVMLMQKIEVEVHSDQQTFLKSLPCDEFADKGKPCTAIWLV